MRTKEFIKKIEDLGFNIEEGSDTYCPRYDSYRIFLDYNLVAVVFKNVIYSFDTARTSFDELENKLKTPLYYVIRSYAETPIEEREEEKKFYLKHRWMVGMEGDYLALDLEEDEFCLDDEGEAHWKKIQFTQKEIEEIKEKYNTDLSDFEMIEVEE
ncbi:hypothetical protein JNO63_07070 [Anaerococcus sp. mt242]|uniref:hypothetical protein n=1 Tax=Anaerococcus sp. mt242 TaxID=2661917 RepID=UPI00193397BB|nr:hypothetical protein [Anaerococcus sp. mt242]MBM0046851.1 hypothetical protein [Anaerococcus sp. mt242]